VLTALAMGFLGEQGGVNELEFFIFCFSKVGKNSWKIPED